jgi:hypothetical protein
MKITLNQSEVFCRRIGGANDEIIQALNSKGYTLEGPKGFNYPFLKINLADKKFQFEESPESVKKSEEISLLLLLADAYEFDEAKTVQCHGGRVTVTNDCVKIGVVTLTYFQFHELAQKLYDCQADLRKIAGISFIFLPRIEIGGFTLVAHDLSQIVLAIREKLE